MKTIVVYYSLGGNTKSAAEKIASELGCGLLEIVPEQSIPAKGFKSILVGGKQAVFGERPRIRKLKPDPKDYDAIILGTPIWAGRCAAPVWTFLSEFEAKERVTAVFTLSGSGDNTKCISRLEKLLSEMKLSVSLVDKNTAKSADNAKKLDEFIGALKADIK